MNRNSEVIGTCTIGYISDSNKYNKFVVKHKKIKKLYVHILHYEWVTHTHIYTFCHSHMRDTHTCKHTHTYKIPTNVSSHTAQNIPTPPPGTSDEFKINMFNKCMYMIMCLIFVEYNLFYFADKSVCCLRFLCCLRF